MKTTTLLLMMLLSTGILLAQTKEYRLDGLRGSIKTLKQTKYDLVSNNGKFTKGDVIYATEETYSFTMKSDGVLEEAKVFTSEKDYTAEVLMTGSKKNTTQKKRIDTDGEVLSVATYNLTSSGLPKEIVWKNPDGTMRWREVYSYSGKVPKEVKNFNEENKIETINHYVYNKKNQCVEMMVSDGGKNIYERYTWVYNPIGPKIEMNQYSGKDKLIARELYKYNDKGDIITTQIYDGSYVFKYEEYCEYTYDSKNNWITQKVTQKNIQTKEIIPKYFYTREFTYR